MRQLLIILMLLPVKPVAAQLVNDCCLQAINLQKQVTTLQTALRDSTAQIDRAWSIIAAYRVQTDRLRAEQKQVVAALQTVPLEAYRFADNYAVRGCFLGLCYRKRMRKIRDTLRPVTGYGIQTH